ncbi:MAG: hypothetical protein FJ082_06840 [Cyanobacteria bacterium K_Offshore_surface_m2_011]|nr:hypothetical protein [Cyanobacteria bacterium K_Offshore_surface_m2_011]
MGPIERILIGLALAAVLLGLRLATRRFQLPPPPLLLPLLAVLLWGVLGGTARPAGVQWLGAVDELATAYALIGLLGWLALECPEALGWWRTTRCGASASTSRWGTVSRSPWATRSRRPGRASCCCG